MQYTWYSEFRLSWYDFVSVRGTRLHPAQQRRQVSDCKLLYERCSVLLEVPPLKNLTTSNKKNMN